MICIDSRNIWPLDFKGQMDDSWKSKKRIINIILQKTHANNDCFVVLLQDISCLLWKQVFKILLHDLLCCLLAHTDKLLGEFDRDLIQTKMLW